MNPSAPHPSSVPFLLRRPASALDDSVEELLDDEDIVPEVTARAVSARRPPPRARIAVDDLPSVIIQEEAPSATMLTARTKLGLEILKNDGEERASARTLLTVRERKQRARGVVRIALGTLVVLGAVGGVAHAMHGHAAVPRAIATILHR